MTSLVLGLILKRKSGKQIGRTSGSQAVANWHFKNLDLIASICKTWSEDTTIPESSRKLFAHAFDRTRAWKQSVQLIKHRHVEQARVLMCEACKASHLCQCTDAKECRVFSCPLIRMSE